MTTYDSNTSSVKLSALKGWSFKDNAIEKQYTFKNFQEAMGFVVRISYICESKNHHPEWTNVYNKLTLRFSTHSDGGVTDKDFNIAAEIDNI